MHPLRRTLLPASCAAGFHTRVLAPAKTHQPVPGQLGAAFTAALATASIRSRMVLPGAELAHPGPAARGRFVAAGVPGCATTVQDSGAGPD